MSYSIKTKVTIPDVTRLINFDGIKRKVDFNKIFAEADSRGYRLTKSEVGPKFKYLLKYDGTYYKVGLLDMTYGLINDGKESMVYHPDGERKPSTIKHDIGICVIMPVYFYNGCLNDEFEVIEVEL